MGVLRIHGLPFQARPYVSGAVIGLFLQDCPVRPRDPDDPVAAVIEVAGSLFVVPRGGVLLRAHRISVVFLIL